MRLLFTAITFFLALNIRAEINPEEVVRTFARVLDEYCQTKDKGVCGAQFDKLCHKRIKCRVENDLMKFISENSIVAQHEGTYLYDTYINEIFKMIDTGCHIKIENVQYNPEYSKLRLVEGEADYIEYDIVVSSKLFTKKSFKDLAVLRDGKITAIYQCAGVRGYIAALKLLMPQLRDEDIYDFDSCWPYIDLSKAQTAFEMFRKIAGSSYGYLSTKSMQMVVAMEMADIGCDGIGKYARTIDMANYFVFHTTCPNIVKRGKTYRVYGSTDFGYYTMASGRTLAEYKLYKGHPYINDQGSAYFHYIYPKYRPMACVNLPYIKKKKGRYGFVSDADKQIVECKYSFAYPFDNQSKLSAVRDDNLKWGFIDTSGKMVIPPTYDIVNDVFVDGKNFAIKDDCLILMNTEGRELRRISGYNYIIPKLQENEIIAYNGIKQQYDVFDFYGNLLLEDCFNVDNMVKNGFERFRIYYYSVWGKFTYNQHDDINKGVFFLPRIPIKIYPSNLSSGDAIDLGIGTLWSSQNLGASSCSDVGIPYLWGDGKLQFAQMKRNQDNGKQYEKQILKRTIPIDIGGTDWDTATQILGKDWRTPSREDWQKLVKECAWEYCILDGSKGYRVVGKNGNSIFIPIEGDFFYEPYEVQQEHGIAFIAYWSSELCSSSHSYSVQMSQYEHNCIRDMGLCYFNYIRPVKTSKD